MAWHRGIEGPGPARPEPVEQPAGPQEQRRAGRSVLGTGTLACPACDAPVSPGGVLAPADGLACPLCAHDASVRDFLSLAAPARPARVEVRVVTHVPGRG